MNYWSTARRGVLGLSAATIAYSVWKKNPVLPLALYGMHLAEYFIVAKKAGKKVWYDDTPLHLSHHALRLHLLASDEA